MLQYDIDLIVYDEVEYFASSSDPAFTYPYQRRKNNVNSYKFRVEETIPDPQFTV